MSEPIGLCGRLIMCARAEDITSTVALGSHFRQTERHIRRLINGSGDRQQRLLELVAQDATGSERAQMVRQYAAIIGAHVIILEAHAAKAAEDAASAAADAAEALSDALAPLRRAA